MEIIFHSHANKTHFHEKACALGLILKVRVFGTRKWPIAFLPISLTSPSSLLKLPIIRLPTVICSPANMFFLHLWPLQFYNWLNAVTTVSAFGFKFKEFAWFLQRFSLKVLLPDVFLNIFTATEGFKWSFQSQRTHRANRGQYSACPQIIVSGTWNSAKAGFERSEQNRKKGNVDDSVSTCCVLWLAI